MNNSIKYVNERNKNEIRMWIRRQLLQGTHTLSLSLCLFCFFLLPSTFCDDLVIFTNSLLLFPLSIEVPWVSGWFQQTMFLLESKNLVCQNQPETQGTSIDSEKRSEEFVLISKSSLKKGCRAKTKKKTHWDGPFLALVEFSVAFCCHFFTVHIFNPNVHFSATVSACLRKDANKQNQWLKMKNRIENLNGRKKNENRMWLKRQLFRGTVPLCVLIFGFFSFNQLFIMTWRTFYFLCSFSYSQCKFLASQNDFVKTCVCKLSQKVSHREGPFLAKVVFSVIFFCHFSFDRSHKTQTKQRRKQAETMPEKMSNKIKTVNSRMKNGNRMWVRTQLSQEGVNLRNCWHSEDEEKTHEEELEWLSWGLAGGNQEFFNPVWFDFWALFAMISFFRGEKFSFSTFPFQLPAFFSFISQRFCSLATMLGEPA